MSKITTNNNVLFFALIEDIIAPNDNYFPLAYINISYVYLNEF